MMFVNVVKYGIWRLLEIICSKFNIYIFIKTRTGLKYINVNRLYGDKTVDYTNREIITITPNMLFLSTDYLKDEYTLLDCCVLDSPHYGLIEAVNNGKDITKTDYYRRFINGSLDGRHCYWKRSASYFHEKNEKAKQAIENGEYEPVVIYKWNDRYYICDGKHRAALCAFLNKDVRCIQVPSISGFKHAAINKEIYRIMAEDNRYSKHIKYLNDGKE